MLADYLINELQSKMPARRYQDIISVIVLRAGLVFLYSVSLRLPHSPVGFIGLKRDEKTAVAEKYYCGLPQFKEDSIVAVFDPMLGTAGTLRQTIQEVNDKFRSDTGACLRPHDLYYVGFLSAESGYRKALMHIPSNNVILLAIDPELDANFYIKPGLGDFGDRYFGN